MATQKIKKVETPIDQRETFVSLQRNFADSEISVEEKLKTSMSFRKPIPPSTRLFNSGENFLRKWSRSRMKSRI